MLISYQTKQTVSEGISHPSSALILPPLVFPPSGDVGVELTRSVLVPNAAAQLGWHILGCFHTLGCFHIPGCFHTPVDAVGCPAHLQV